MRILIRSLRERQGLTLEGLAERANISASFLSRIENGKRVPSFEVMMSLADALGVSFSEIIETTPYIVTTGEIRSSRDIHFYTEDEKKQEIAKGFRRPPLVDPIDTVAIEVKTKELKPLAFYGDFLVIDDLEVHPPISSVGRPSVMSFYDGSCCVGILHESEAEGFFNVEPIDPFERPLRNVEVAYAGRIWMVIPGDIAAAVPVRQISD